MCVHAHVCVYVYVQVLAGELSTHDHGNLLAQAHDHHDHDDRHHDQDVNAHHGSHRVGGCCEGSEGVPEWQKAVLVVLGYSVMTILAIWT